MDATVDEVRVGEVDLAHHGVFKTFKHVPDALVPVGSVLEGLQYPVEQVQIRLSDAGEATLAP